MAKQSLGYPHYDDWLQHSEPELQEGYKGAILGFYNSQLIGDLVFQPHKQLPQTIEIKNLRIHPMLRRRDCAHFMLKQLEVEYQQKIGLIITDTRASQTAVLALLNSSGYKELARAPIYDSNEEDVVLVKPISEQNNLISLASSLF